nr:MBL fold metallo-hydrolase [Viridibacillus arvi]
MLFQTGNENVLIDGGNNGQGNEVVAYLKKQKVKILNAVVLTHPDADHVYGLAEVIDTLKVKSVYATKVILLSFMTYYADNLFLEGMIK